MMKTDVGGKGREHGRQWAGARPRILIVRLSAIGDTALTLPLLFALRQRLSGAHIGWVVGETAAPLLEGLTELDRLHVWRNRDLTPTGMWRLVRELRAEHYELSIDPQGLSKSALLPYLAGIPRRVGFMPAALESRELAPLLLNRKVSVPEDVTHIARRTLYLGSALDLSLDHSPLVRLPRDPGAEARVDAWWRQQGLGPRTLVLGIGAGWPTKVWPVRHMAALAGAAEGAGYRCVLLWGPAERRHLRQWQTLLGRDLLWAPPTDLPQMLALLRRAAGYAGPDSAALHLAWLLGCPTFSWFGASEPARCAPFGPDHTHVARGPHNWRRTALLGNPLKGLLPGQVLPSFLDWLLGLTGKR